jgi:hypothetical protein
VHFEHGRSARGQQISKFFIALKKKKKKKKNFFSAHNNGVGSPEFFCVGFGVEKLIDCIGDRGKRLMTR